MLFFIDESWQTTQDKKYKVGILSAVQIKTHDFNECSNRIRELKIEHLGLWSGDIEIKGNGILRRYLFGLEAKGVKSRELNLARGIIEYMRSIDVKLFASIVFSGQELDLSCANVNQLERPFFFLFERINIFMEENYPGLMAQLIFDDRDVKANQRISKSVSNFFHKSRAGQQFDAIIKVPFFAISTENVGIQMADMVAYVLGARFTGDQLSKEFFGDVKSLEFRSRALFDIQGRSLPMRGFKVVKEKETGGLFSPGRTK